MGVSVSYLHLVVQGKLGGRPLKLLLGIPESRMSHELNLNLFQLQIDTEAKTMLIKAVLTEIGHAL